MTATDARSSSCPDNPHSITSVLDRAREATDGEKTTVDEIVETLGSASHSAIILIPALLAITPLSGIPGASSIFGIIIALVSGELVFGRRSLWLPQWVLRIGVDSGRLNQALEWLERPAGFVDRHTRQRLTFLVKPPGRTFLQVICMLCGAAMPFLELVPFSSSILGAAVAFFAVALVVRDGLLAAIGFCVIACAGSVAYLFFN